MAGKKVIGAIYLDRQFGQGLFSEADRKFLTIVACLITPAIERSDVFERLRAKSATQNITAVTESGQPYLLGESSAVREIKVQIEACARCDASVLITGETGCGKGLVAKCIHLTSTKHRFGRFISFSCAAVPETLLESELFGYKKGSFTGATADKPGLFEMAGRGSLFLDDIANAPLSVQAKLLEAVEEKTIRRLGETAARHVDVRLISATNQDLEALIAKGIFRADLFYRINVLTIHIPPLRQRITDIPILAQYFLNKCSAEHNRSNIQGFAKDAIRKMLGYPWPGNVRELQNVIENTVLTTKNTGYLTSGDLRLMHVEAAGQHGCDKQTILDALSKTRGNVTQAAKIMGITRQTVYNHMRRLGIGHEHSIS